MKTLKFLIIGILVTITLYPNIAFANTSKSVISVNDTQYDITFNTGNLSINKISTNLHSYVYNSLVMNITSNTQYNGSLTLTLTKDAVANIFCITRSDIDNYLKSGSAFDVTVDNNHKNFTTSTINDEVSLTFDIPKGSQNATVFNEFVGMAVSPLMYFKGIPQTGTYSSGQGVIFNGTLVDACGRHLGVEKVYFTAEQLNVTKEVTSDTKGKFNINFTIPTNTESGNYTSKIEMYQHGSAYPLSGIETLYLNVGTNNTQIVPESPLQQFKSGTPASDVKCNDGLQLIIKAEDGSPICVKHDTATKLVERGWALDQVQQKSENIAANSSSALKLYLSTNSTIIQSGHTIGITLSLDNTRPSLLNLNSQNNWPIQGLDSGGCSWLPMGIAILDGYYTAQNMSDGHPMLLHFLYPCPPSLPVKTFTFQPMSSSITVTCEPGDWAPCQYLTQTKTSVSYSSFLQDGKFFDFNPGNYTLVAGDEWGDSVIQHFQVVNSTRTHIEYDPPIVTQTYDARGTIKDIMPNTTFAKLASSSTGIQIARGGGLNTYDNDNIKLELDYGKTSDSHVVSATVENLGKKTVHIYDIFISGFVPLANDNSLNFVVVRGDPYVVLKDDAILEPGESITKYIVGNWTVGGKPANGFSAGASYSYDDLQNFDGMTNGYSMSIPIQWIK